MVVFIAAVLSAAPIQVEQLGFSVIVRDEQVVVTAVAAGGPAEKGRLRVGDVISKILAPQWRFARGKLAALGEVDLHDALNAPASEPLVVSIKRADGESTVVEVQRDGPAPAPEVEFPEPLPVEKLERLSLRQQSRYFWALAQVTRKNAEARRDRQPLVELGADDAPRAWVAQGRVVPGANAAVSPDWVYFSDVLNFRCPRGPPGRVTIAVDGPVPPRFEQPRDKAAFTQVELALWRVRDVVASCAGSVPIAVKPAQVRVSAQCEGEATVREAVLDVPLERTCGPAPATVISERFGVLLFDDALVVGAAGPRVDVSWGMLRPRPTEVTLVELDEQRVVTKRLQTLRPPANPAERQSLAAPVDTKRARTVRLGVELLFADGSREVVSDKPVEIITAAEEALRTAQFRTDSDRAEEVMRELLRRGDPCADVPKALDWLRKQPGVTLASGTSHDFSYAVGRVPRLVLCHAGR